MAPRFSGRNYKFFKFLLFLNSQKRLGYKENNTKYSNLTWKPRSHVRILIYRTWLIDSVRRKNQSDSCEDNYQSAGCLCKVWIIFFCLLDVLFSHQYLAFQFSLTFFTNCSTCNEIAPEAENRTWCTCARDRMCPRWRVLQDWHQREGKIPTGSKATATVPGERYWRRGGIQ